MSATFRIFRPLAGGDRLTLGFAIQNDSGWRFIPHNAVNKPSRKSHPTLGRCLPRWIGKYYEIEENHR